MVSVPRSRSTTESPHGGDRRPGKRRHRSRRPVLEDFLADSDFRSALDRIAAAKNLPPEQALSTAERHLKEIAARPSRLMVNVAALLGRILYGRAYGAVHHDQQGLAAVSELAARFPVVFLPCHRSNLDRPVMHDLLWKNGLGPNYTAGGINMNFFPIGPISRRAGVFFIRRSFTNNPTYRLVLQAYFAHLVEQRRSLEWYMEGGRSRTGKIRSPRYGLLGYAADALAAGRSDDIYLIPTSINYDHVLEVGEFAAQESGFAKEKETFGWLVRSVRSLRRRYGDIHVRFGRPVSMRTVIDPDRTGTERRQDLQRLATTVCMRINRITPVTPASLVAVALLGSPEGGVTRPTLEATVAELVEDAESRSLPASEPLSLLRTRKGLDDVIGSLANLGMVTERKRAAGNDQPRPAYGIAPGRRLAASYYRNTIVHFFLGPAIGELALAAAGANSGRPIRTFHEYAAKLTELLSKEFFFGDHDTFVGEMEEGLDRRLPGWRGRLAGGTGARSRGGPPSSPGAVGAPVVPGGLSGRGGGTGRPPAGSIVEQALFPGAMPGSRGRVRVRGAHHRRSMLSEPLFQRGADRGRPRSSQTGTGGPGGTANVVRVRTGASPRAGTFARLRTACRERLDVRWQSRDPAMTPCRTGCAWSCTTGCGLPGRWTTNSCPSGSRDAAWGQPSTRGDTRRSAWEPGAALQPEDVVAPMHRDLGCYLIRGMSPRRIFANQLGRSTGVTGGRDANLHGCGDLSLNIIGFISHLPQSMPVALGAAMSFIYRNEPRVAMTFAGDGSSCTGVFHETLNLAAVHRAPFVRDRRREQPVRLLDTARTADGHRRHRRACAAHMGSGRRSSTGTTSRPCIRAVEAAIARARRGAGPSLIEAKTMRMLGHAIHDGADYVPGALLQEWKPRDPLTRFEETILARRLVDRDHLDEVADECRQVVADAVRFAESSFMARPEHGR